jgi:hypothetical protein
MAKNNEIYFLTKKQTNIRIHTSFESIEILLSYLVLLNGPLTLFVRLVALSRRARILFGSLLVVSSVVSPFRFELF